MMRHLPTDKIFIYGGVNMDHSQIHKSLEEAMGQIGRYLPRGMKIHQCPIHGSYLSHYTQAEPICPECNKVLTSTNQGNGESASALEHMLDMQQDAMHAARARDMVENAFGITRGMADPDLVKARSAKQWTQISKDKAAKYGKETYADPSHHSYPLTKDGKPSEERTMAAWRYINEKHNSGEYSDGKANGIKAKIKRYAKEHFGKELED